MVKVSPKSRSRTLDFDVVSSEKLPIMRSYLIVHFFLQATDTEYANNDWIEQLTSDRLPSASNEIKFQKEASSSRQVCLADRYFTTRYFPDVCKNNAHDDLCVMQHSNRICVIGLAPGHAVFSKCVNDANHRIVGVDFQLNTSFNLLQCKVSGRRKRGSHRLQQGDGNHCLGYAVCDRGERHALWSGGKLPGRLYESNSRLSIKLPEAERISLTPVGHGGNNAAYLAVIMPPRTKSEDTTGVDQHIIDNDGFLTGGLTWDEYKVLRNL